MNDEKYGLLSIDQSAIELKDEYERLIINTNELGKSINGVSDSMKNFDYTVGNISDIFTNSITNLMGQIKGVDGDFLSYIKGYGTTMVNTVYGVGKQAMDNISEFTSDNGINDFKKIEMLSQILSKTFRNTDSFINRFRKMVFDTTESMADYTAVLELLPYRTDLLTQKIVEVRLGLDEMVSSITDAVMLQRKLITDTSEKIREGLQDFSTFNQLLGSQGVNIYEMDESTQLSLTQKYKSLAATFGKQLDDVMSMQSGLANETGLNRLLNVEDMSDLFMIGRLLDITDDKMGELVANFTEVGYSANYANELIYETIVASSKQGLNAKAVSETLVNNMEKVNQMTFVNGTRAVQKMAMLSQKFKLDMATALNFADSIGLGGPEASIEMSAKLGALGGPIASSFYDPIEMMGMARNSPEELMERMVESLSGYYTRGNDGNMEITALNRSYIKEVADAMGLEYSDLMRTSLRSSKIDAYSTDVFNQLKNSNLDGFNTKTAENIAANAFMEGGVMKVNIPGEDEAIRISELSNEHLDKLLMNNMSQKDVLISIDGSMKTIANRSESAMYASSAAFFDSDEFKKNLKTLTNVRDRLLDTEYIESMVANTTEALKTIADKFNNTAAGLSLSLAEDKSMTKVNNKKVTESSITGPLTGLGIEENNTQQIKPNNEPSNYVELSSVSVDTTSDNKILPNLGFSSTDTNKPSEPAIALRDKQIKEIVVPKFTNEDFIDTKNTDKNQTSNSTVTKNNEININTKLELDVTKQMDPNEVVSMIFENIKNKLMSDKDFNDLFVDNNELLKAIANK